MTIDEVFSATGLLAQQFSDYEVRPSQVEMAHLVDSAIATGSPAIIEGATGVGKSYAYLVPIILAHQQAIISTSNKSLQDQLSNKDLPDLKKILSIPFTWAVLKGKNNYFCPQRFRANLKELNSFFYKQGLNSKAELNKIIRWSEQTQDGDLEYYPESLDPKVKEWIGCDNKLRHLKGSSWEELCFAHKAKDRAKTSQIVLVNHTLISLDISLRKETEGKARILPDINLIVIDEAHTFEEYATMAFSDELSFHSLLHLINSEVVRDLVSPTDLNRLSEAFKGALQPFLPPKGIKYYTQRKEAVFGGFEEATGLLRHIISKFETEKDNQRTEEDRLKIEEVLKEAKNLVARIVDFGTLNEEMLRWSEARDTKYGPIIKLRSIPYDISPILSEELFAKHTVICTSATLAVGRSFDFFKEQMGMPQTTLEMVANSPFNFQKNALIYISNGEAEKYWEIEKLLNFSKGRAFVLFTSYSDMESCFEKVKIPYPKLMQTNGISRSQLLEEFKNTPNAVLFATKSFWEGVDVKGDQLLLVIIHKLPFNTPSDLVYASKSEKIDAKFGKGKHWVKLTIPDACIKLKQGVGRLIRSKTDIGVIALLDARVNFRNYGKAVLRSLPPAPKTQQLDHVEHFYQKWNR